MGRRLAFDQAKGRLWVICTTCARWNLSPLEERWEAIEACEKLYRDTRKRVATEQMGLAKAGDGLTLVRIGRPVFPEYASWRYGERFGQRRNRYRILAGAAVVAGAVVFVGGPFVFSTLTGVGGGGGYFIYQGYKKVVEAARQRKRIGHLATASGERSVVRAKDVDAARLRIGSDRTLSVDLDRLDKRGGVIDDAGPWMTYHGDDARTFLRIALPHFNRKGATENDVALAVGLMGLDQGAADPLDAALDHLLRNGWHSPRLATLSPTTGIGLEMAVMEGQERRWMETEIHLLEASWQEAEKLAAIADSLLLPEWVSEKLGRLRGNDGQVGG